MVWVYERTGSLLVMLLMQASDIFSTLFVLAPPNGPTTSRPAGTEASPNGWARRRARTRSAAPQAEAARTSSRWGCWILPTSVARGLPADACRALA